MHEIGSSATFSWCSLISGVGREARECNLFRLCVCNHKAMNSWAIYDNDFLLCLSFPQYSLNSSTSPEMMGFFPPIFFSCMETSRTELAKQMQMLWFFYSFIQAWGHEIGVLLLCFQHEGRGLYDTSKMMVKKIHTSTDICNGSLGSFSNSVFEEEKISWIRGKMQTSTEAVVLLGVPGGSESPNLRSTRTQR